MSRSMKKVPIIKSGGYGKYGKHLANKKVRKFNYIANGNNYRKLFESWDIFDYKSNLYKLDKKDGIPVYHYSKDKMTLNEIMHYWRK